MLLMCDILQENSAWCVNDDTIAKTTRQRQSSNDMWRNEIRNVQLVT